jgi:cobalt-zinc-cadmium efflux system outer membrane protein
MVPLAGLAMVLALSRPGWAQAPTIEQTGLLSSGIGAASPGSTQSLLGPMPGGGANLGMQPGRDELLFGGRLGPAVPRVPTSITMPGGAYQGPPPSRGIAAPQPLPVPQPPFYGTLELPKGPEDEGPPSGLTLDQTIDQYLRQNLNLRALFLELPQARADVLTASLRANPIFYADAQLVPYGNFSTSKPSGPTQYDINISHPIDFSHKRQARTIYAELALRVMEQQYQDAVRTGLGGLYVTYVDVLAARRTVHYAQVNARGLEEFLRVTRIQYQKAAASSADVYQAQSDARIGAVSLLDTEETLRQRQRTLAELLNIPPDQAEALEFRGTLEDRAPPPPSDADLIRLALECRSDVAAYRLGVQAAEAALKLALANRFADAYLLFQPFTYQNNTPYGDKGSVPAWALGITVPLPVYNHNQGNIQRARINVHQSRVQLAQTELRVRTEVIQAAREYWVSRRIVEWIRDEILPPLVQAIDDRDRLFREGEVTREAYLNQRRKYNDTAKQYLDSAVRHRKAMLALNTAVGQRILP